MGRNSMRQVGARDETVRAAPCSTTPPRARVLCDTVASNILRCQIVVQCVMSGAGCAAQARVREHTIRPYSRMSWEAHAADIIVRRR